MTNLLDKNAFLRINGEIESLTQKYLTELEKCESSESLTHKVITKYLKEVKRLASVSKPKTCD